MHVHENVPCTLIQSYAATKDVQGEIVEGWDRAPHTHTHRAQAAQSSFDRVGARRENTHKHKKTRARTHTQAAQSSFNRVGDVLGGEREPWMWAGEGLDDEELLNYEVGLST
jgi:hypothetical protein